MEVTANDLVLIAMAVAAGILCGFFWGIGKILHDIIP